MSGKKSIPVSVLGQLLLEIGLGQEEGEISNYVAQGLKLFLAIKLLWGFGESWIPMARRINMHTEEIWDEWKNIN